LRRLQLTLITRFNAAFYPHVFVHFDLVQLLRFHPNNQSWEALPPMASARGAFAFVVLPSVGVDAGAIAFAAIGGVASVPGNKYAFVNLATVELFSVASRSWSHLPSLPSGRGQVQGVVVGSRVLVVGGTNSTNDVCDQGASIFQRDVLALNVDNVSYVSYGGRRWETVTKLPSPRGFVAAAVLRSDTVVVIGGINVSSIDCATVEDFNTTSGVWCHA
jgi:N-acetylneuraminic acid mutarotase